MEKQLMILAVLALLLLAGCATNPNQAAQKPGQAAVPIPIENKTSTNAGPAQPVPDCIRFCQNSTHPECNGTWNITGVYPDCACGYICPASVPKIANATNPSGNASANPPEQINMTISQLLDQGMKRIQSDFYRTNSGVFTEKSYTWSRLPASTDMDSISFDASPGGDVKVDNKSLDSIVASGFVVFEGEGIARQTYGLLISKGDRTILDDYSGSEMFSLDYFPATIDKELRDCTAYERKNYITANGDAFVSYSFVCWKVYDK